MSIGENINEFVAERDHMYKILYHTALGKKDGSGLPADHSLRQTWHGMIQRCYNYAHHSFKLYGGRGIEVCDRWFNFKNFVEDMGKKPGKEFSLDRIDGELGYSPENCRWASRKEQAANIRPREKELAAFRHTSMMKRAFR